MGNRIGKLVFYAVLFIIAVTFAGCAEPKPVPQPPPPPPPPRVKDSIALHILFDYNKATIKEQEMTELGKGVEFVKKYPGSKIEIAGHTDNIGKPQYNQTLSEKRAEAVREYLIREGGVAPANISSVGYRDLYPIAPNQKPDGKDNPEGRAKNRRVEINILSD